MQVKWSAPLLLSLVAACGAPHDDSRAGAPESAAAAEVDAALDALEAACAADPGAAQRALRRASGASSVRRSCGTG